MTEFNELHSKEKELILNLSISYLTRKDLKSCRLVNKQFENLTIKYYYKQLYLVYPAKTKEFGDKNLIKRATEEFNLLMISYLKHSHLTKYIELNIFCNKSLITAIINGFPNLEGFKFTYVDFYEINTRYIYSNLWHLDDLILVGCSDMSWDNCFYNLSELKFPMEEKNEGLPLNQIE